MKKMIETTNKGKSIIEIIYKMQMFIRQAINESKKEI